MHLRLVFDSETLTVGDIVHETLIDSAQPADHYHRSILVIIKQINYEDLVQECAKGGSCNNSPLLA